MTADNPSGSKDVERTREQSERMGERLAERTTGFLRQSQHKMEQGREKTQDAAAKAEQAGKHPELQEAKGRLKDISQGAKSTMRDVRDEADDAKKEYREPV